MKNRKVNRFFVGTLCMIAGILLLCYSSYVEFKENNLLWGYLTILLLIVAIIYTIYDIKIKGLYGQKIHTTEI